MKQSGMITMTAVAGMLLLLGAQHAVSAGDPAPMTPEVAAKREMVRQQESQRVTTEKRRAAAEALKQERLKLHQLKQEQQGNAAQPAEQPKQ